MIVKCLCVSAVIILCHIGSASNDPLPVYLLGKMDDARTRSRSSPASNHKLSCECIHNLYILFYDVHRVTITLLNTAVSQYFNGAHFQSWCPDKQEKMFTK